MKIRVGFSTAPGWFSRIIRICTRSKVSHTYIRVFDEFLDTSLVLHVERKMEILRAEEFDRDNTVVEEYEIDDDRLNESVKNSLRHLGKKFNWLSWMGWFPIVNRWVKTKIKSPTHKFKRMICVNLILKVLNEAKITHLPYAIMTPHTLRQWFEYFHEEFGWKREVFDE